jgi:hemerythrin
MAFFDWDDKYSVKIDAIDTQHKKIVELMNELFESIRDAREELIIKDVLNDLMAYTDYHFGLEAKLFEKFHYERSAEHLGEHRYFIEKIRNLMKDVEPSAQKAAMETMDFLRDWFRNHMLKVDIEYSRFFESKDVIKEIESTVI